MKLAEYMIVQLDEIQMDYGVENVLRYRVKTVLQEWLLDKNVYII